MVGAEAGLLQHPHAGVVRLPFELAQEVLEQERHAPERPLGQPGEGLFARAIEAAQDHCVELRVEPFDAGDGGVDQLDGRNVSVPHQLRLRGRVQPKQVVHGGTIINMRRLVPGTWIHILKQAGLTTGDRR